MTTTNAYLGGLTDGAEHERKVVANMLRVKARVIREKTKKHAAGMSQEERQGQYDVASELESAARSVEKNEQSHEEYEAES